MSPFQNTDLLLVQRGAAQHKATVDVLKGYALDGSIIHSATPPTSPPYTLNNGTVWVDTSQSPAIINVWDPTANGGAGGWEQATAAGPKPANPAPSDVTAAPAFVSGTGTQADPFVITPSTVAAPGGATTSAQTITINGKAGDTIAFVDLNAGTHGARFTQAAGVIGAGGSWSGTLSYLDTPNSVAGATFTGDLKIGTTYFRWVVTQQVSVPPVIDTVVLADSPEAGRFTSGTFQATVTMTNDGVPPSTKGLKAWVEGTLKSKPVSDEITASAGTGTPEVDPTVGELQYKTNNTASTNAHSLIYGKTAQDANGTAAHKAFLWAENLNFGTGGIGGFTDWYVPAYYEADILYFNLKPSTDLNNVNPPNAGKNPYSVPPRTNKMTTTVPAQTTAVLFKEGASEAFSSKGTTQSIWTASEIDASSAHAYNFQSGDSIDGQSSKTNTHAVRLIRRVAKTGSEPAIGEPYAGGYFGGFISTAGTGVADYALIVAPNAEGTYGYIDDGTPADPLVLTLKTDKDLANFAAGDAVTEKASGGAAGDATGTVVSVDVTAKTISLLPISGTWDVGSFVVGPEKAVANTKLYTVHNAAGAVSDLQSADPGYVTMTGSSPYALTFPATLPSGNAPDTDLPAGTTLTTEIQASNGGAPVTKTSNTVTPS